MNEDRREAQRQGGLLRRDNLISPAETLKRREAWKYVLMEKILNEAGIKHEFEYEMGPFVFDLAILDKKILVEFDGKSHQTRAQRELDIQKDKMANKKGFIVVRRETPEMAVVDPIVLEGLL
jgi:very-short-patch-repair endonuclease